MTITASMDEAKAQTDCRSKDGKNGNDLAALHEKLDCLAMQIEAQNRRYEVMHDLWQDMVPVANHLTRLTIEELDEIGNDFQLEDVIYFFKRVLRDMRLLTKMLEQLESLTALGEDAQRISKPAFGILIDLLHDLEQKGYFTFANGLVEISDRIVNEFGEDDLKALGDNIVTILTTVKNMTQPEIMSLANNAIAGVGEPVKEDISTWTLLRELRDPDVRKGMARLIHVVKGLANQQDTPSSN